MPNKQFEHCKVCRLNHNQGKGHKFSTKHKQRLDSHLSKALLKIRDISFFLSNPTFLRQSDRALNAFWCSFCDITISELDSTFVCSNTLRHLASPSHLDAIKIFWYENGADVEKRHLYGIQTEELAKWEDACKALSAASTSMELAHGAVNRMGTAVLIELRKEVWLFVVPTQAIQCWLLKVMELPHQYAAPIWSSNQVSPA